ncbi:MAG: VOC family protein [Stackebrandtia sp.]
MITESFPILTTADLQRALHFYRDLLGFAVTYEYRYEGTLLYVSLTAASSTIGIGEDAETSGRDRDNGTFSLCMYVNDCDAAVEKLRAAGVAVLSEPVTQPWGERMAEVSDPDGIRVALMSKVDGG